VVAVVAEYSLVQAVQAVQQIRIQPLVQAVVQAVAVRHLPFKREQVVVAVQLIMQVVIVQVIGHQAVVAVGVHQAEQELVAVQAVQAVKQLILMENLLLGLQEIQLEFTEAYHDINKRIFARSSFMPRGLQIWS